MTTSGRRLLDLTVADLAVLAAACRDRQQWTGKDHHHYLAVLSNTQRVLFHLGVLDRLPCSGGPVPFAGPMAEVRPGVPGGHDRLSLKGKRATCQPKTVSAIATRLTHFGVFLADIDPSWHRSPHSSGADTLSPTQPHLSGAQHQDR